MSSERFPHITVEEHFSTAPVQQRLAELARRHGRAFWWGQHEGEAYDKLVDLGQRRIAAMDRAGVDVQVLSLSSPGVNDFDVADATAIARDVNDMVSEAVRQFPGRLVAMATVALQDPVAAAAELERATGTLGLRGMIVNGQVGGEYLDDQRFWPVLEAAEALGVTLYLHPAHTAEESVIRYVEVPGFGGWTLGVDESAQVAKLIAGGALDRFPGLRVVVGHLGGGIVFALPRIDHLAARFAAAGLGGVARRLPGDYLRRNFSVTTSGMLYPQQVRLAIELLGADRVLLATDYPHEDLDAELTRFRQLPLTDQERRLVAGENAASLYGLSLVPGQGSA